MGKRAADPAEEDPTRCTICGTTLVDDLGRYEIQWDRWTGTDKHMEGGQRWVCTYCWGCLRSEIKTLRTMCRRWER